MSKEDKGTALGLRERGTGTGQDLDLKRVLPALSLWLGCWCCSQGLFESTLVVGGPLWCWHLRLVPKLFLGRCPLLFLRQSSPWPAQTVGGHLGRERSKRYFILVDSGHLCCSLGASEVDGEVCRTFTVTVSHVYFCKTLKEMQICFNEFVVLAGNLISHPLLEHLVGQHSTVVRQRSTNQNSWLGSIPG